MNGLVFYSSKNSHGKSDATGAFIPEAKAFARLHGIPGEDVIGINCTKGNKATNRRAIVVKELSARPELDVLAFFGHGWPDGIQFGFRRKHIPFLVSHIQARSSTLVVGLFACLAAENDVRDRERKNIGPGTDGGFADLLRDEMVRKGIECGWVDAHKTAGHTNWNPYVVRFPCEDVSDPEYGAEGGAWLVAPGSYYWKKWCSQLKKRKTGMRYEFLTLDEADVMKRLMA